MQKGRLEIKKFCRLNGPPKVFVFNPHPIHLSRPPVLEAMSYYRSERMLLDNKYNSAHSSTKVAIGIIVENYSRYRLQDARVNNHCWANREVSQVILILIYMIRLIRKFSHRSLPKTFLWEM